MESGKKVNSFENWNVDELSLDSEYKSGDDDEFNESKKYTDDDEAKFLTSSKKSKKVDIFLNF